MSLDGSDYSVGVRKPGMLDETVMQCRTDSQALNTESFIQNLLVKDGLHLLLFPLGRASLASCVLSYLIATLWLLPP